MRRVKGMRAAVLLTVPLALLASGCSGGSQKADVLPSLTATPSATPTATPVIVPAAARVHDSFGAAAFVRFFYAQINLAFQNADPSLLEGLGDPKCSTCANFVASASMLRSKGQHIQGTYVRVLSAEAPPEEQGLVAVDVQADAPARLLVDAAGKVVQRGPAEAAYRLTVYAQHVSSGWVIRAVKKAT